MLWRIVTLIALVLVPLVAFAADAPTAADQFSTAVGVLFRDSIAPVITGFALGLIGVILDLVRKRTGLKLSQENEARLLEWAKQGVAIAQEKGEAYIKANAGRKMPGGDKLKIAMSHLMAFAPKVTPEQADALVHAALARTAGAGATKDAVQ